MADELIDIYDENIQHLGTAMKYVAHREGLWHKIFFCWILSQDNQGHWNIWLQLRNKHKKIGGGLLDASSAGHFAAGENLEQALSREVWEELGLKMNFDDIKNYGVGKRKSGDASLKNYEICYKCYATTSVHPQDLQLQRDELDGILLLPIEEAINLFTNKKARVTLDAWVFDDENQYIKTTQFISVSDFMDYGQEAYLSFFTNIKNILEG